MNDEIRDHAAELLTALARARTIDDVSARRFDLIVAGQPGADPQLAFATDPFRGLPRCPVEDPDSGLAPGDLGCPTTTRGDGTVEHVDGHRDVRLVVRIAHATRTAKDAINGRPAPRTTSRTRSTR